MKKFIILVLTFAVLLSFTACSDKEDTTTTNNSGAVISDGELNTGMKEHFDQMEYAAYCDLFINKNTSDYENKTFTKTGTFAILVDAFYNVTRYYVWGYADNTKCCDYQWEFIIPEGTEIPEPGSHIEITGTMKYSDAALDKYRFEDVTLTVKSSFSNAGFDMDMTTMSPTLVRVEIQNMLQFPEKFAQKTIRLFGRALSTNTIQHPYYNENWSVHFTQTDTVPTIGDYILIEGTYSAEGAQKLITTDKLTIIG